jgi:hypothetical protein
VATATEDRPTTGYAALMTTYAAGTLGAAAYLKRSGRVPERIPAADIALAALATHKLSRLVTRDKVTAPVRAPFTEEGEPGGAGEVIDKPAGSGVRKAVGELLTCPFCLGVWVATAFAVALAVAPRATRLVASALAITAGSDALQYAYAALQKTED